jgi:prolyl oligopeptidase
VAALPRRAPGWIPAALLLGCASAAPEPAPAPAPPLPLPEVPVTRTVDHVDDYHGVKVPDPYRWMEEPGSEEVRAWVEAQNRTTEAFLARVPEREGIRKRLTELWDFERFGLPRREGGRLFFTRNDGLQDQAVLLVRDGDGDEPRVLLDPNGLSKDGTVALVQWEPSEDGSLLAYGISRAGSDWVEWRVREVATGADRPDALLWSKFSGCAWAKDGSGFWYSRYDAPPAGREFEVVLENQKLCFHRLGTPQEADAVVYARPDRPKWGFGATVSGDGRLLVVHVWEGSQPENRLYLKDLGDPAAAVRPILDAADASYEFVDAVEGGLLVLTNRRAPRGRLVLVDPADPAESRWRTLIPEGKDTLSSVHSVGGRLVAAWMRDARSVVTVHGRDGAPEREIALPGTGTASGFTGRPEHPESWFVYTDFFTPPSIFRCTPADGAVEAFRVPRLRFDPASFETEQVFVPSSDGARIPVFLSRKKGLPRDGERPVLLYGYGGFNVSLTPGFSVTHLAWMERGGVYAMACLRGGGEYGEAWHKSAILENRPKAHGDFLAAAEWLCANGWTRPGRLAISGGSNGGLLVGACLVRRPDLFGAAMPSMGVMDMLRYHRFTIGWAWAAEYGTSDDAGHFRFLREYSPLHNLRAGTRYPPTLVCTADTDDRVVPAHSYKFAAALQAAAAGPGPALLRVDVRSGHGMGAPTRMLIARAADQLAFLVEALGVR